MKKILCLLLIATMTTITGCGNKQENASTQSEENIIVTAEETSKDTEELSDDLYNFELLINGEKFTLPCDYKEVSDKGWSIKDNADSTLEPNQYSMSTDMINGEKTFCARFLNTDVNELHYNECRVGGIIISDTDVKHGIEIELPKGINMKSTKDEIINAYGEPTKNRESGDLVYLNYELNNYQKIQFTINQKKNEVTKLQMDNMSADKSNSTNGNSTSTPSDTSAQDNAPKSNTELGDDLFSKNIEVEGAVYTLPASIKEFEANGWKVQDEAGQMVNAKDTDVRVSLRKNNSVIKVSAKNNTANQTEVENCDITRIQVREDDKISLKLPKGVGIGSTKADLEAAYPGMEKKKSDSNNFDYYNYLKDGLSINVSVSKDSGKIATIEVNYMK